MLEPLDPPVWDEDEELPEGIGYEHAIITCSTCGKTRFELEAYLVQQRNSGEKITCPNCQNTGVPQMMNDRIQMSGELEDV